MTITSPVTLELPDPEATQASGARLGPALESGMVVTLSGDLGAGKTTLVRGVLRGRGWTAPVKSPTYTVVEIYPVSSLYFYHFDFYRFEDPTEWETAGLADYFRADAVCLVEWPERACAFLPPADLEIVLSHPADVRMAGRRASLYAHSAAGERCLGAMITPVDQALRR